MAVATFHDPALGRRSQRDAVVAQAEAYLRAHLDSPVPVPSWVAYVGISERGLRNAFYDVHAMGPKQWMLVDRLEGVRRALRDWNARPATVTSVATRLRFDELGRFAVAYRRAFGEAPSVTLRQWLQGNTDAGQP